MSLKTTLKEFDIIILKEACQAYIKKGRNVEWSHSYV
jgi:hypothetical protein